MSHGVKDIIYSIGGLVVVVLLLALTLSPPESHQPRANEYTPIDCGVTPHRDANKEMVIRNLCEQQSLALSASRMVWATYTQIIVGFVTLLFLFFTFRNQKNELDAANRTAKAAENAAFPYIFVELLPNFTDAKKTHIILEFELANYGKTPARDLNIILVADVERKSCNGEFHEIDFRNIEQYAKEERDLKPYYFITDDVIALGGGATSDPVKVGKFVISDCTRPEDENDGLRIISTFVYSDMGQVRRRVDAVFEIIFAWPYYLDNLDYFEDVEVDGEMIQTKAERTPEWYGGRVSEKIRIKSLYWDESIVGL